LIAIGILALTAWVLLSADANAHSCYLGLENSRGINCCSDQDCRPVTAGEIEWQDGTWYFNGNPVDSRDVLETAECDHPAVCLPNGGDKPRCLIVPLGV
jgi:hypothetical protein